MGELAEAHVQETLECHPTWRQTSQTQALSLQTSGSARLDQLSQEVTRPHPPQDQQMVQQIRQIQEQLLTGRDQPIPLKTQTHAPEEVSGIALQCAHPTPLRYSRAV